MHDADKTKAQLLAELAALRQQNAALETANARDITDRAQAEDALRLTQFAIDHSSDAIFWVGYDARLFYVNHAACRSLGYTRDELLAMRIHDLDPDYPPDVWPDHWEQAIRESPMTFETSHHTKDGRIFPVEVTTNYLDYHGYPYICSFVRDITKRKQAEEARRRSESRYRTLVEGSIQGIVILSRDGRRLFANQAFVQMLGYDSYDDYRRYPAMSNLAPHERTRLQQYFDDLWHGKSTSARYEYEVIRVDGSLIWLERLVTLIEWDDEPAMLSTVIDITERKHTEHALRESEELYRNLVDQAADGIWIADSQGQYIEVNPSGCAMLGYTREEFLRKRVGDFIPNDDLEVVPLKLEPLRQGEVLVSERHLTRSDGSLIPVEISAKLLPDGRLQCIVRDITERKRLERQLRQSQKMEAVGTLAGGVAHDFNNMLGVIFAYTEMAKSDLPSHHDLQENLQHILSAAARAKDLVQQILTFSRQSETKRQTVKLAPVIQEALGLLRASLPTTIDIRCSLPDTGDTMYADRTQLHQIVLNLCVNAGHAMRDIGGCLDINLQPVEIDREFAALCPALQPGPHLHLTIRDTGHGIPPDLIDRIFDPFFTTKGVGEGTGMGLAMVHGTVASHGGAIRVESHPGHGSTFELYFPCVPEQVGESQPVHETTEHGASRLMLVDDEAVLVNGLKALLMRLGYEVAAYTSSREALAAFAANPQQFDFVVTDQTMPQLTGKELARALRDYRPDIPIILCTGFSHAVNADIATEQDIDAYCMKPLSAQELSATIQKVLEKRRPAPQALSTKRGGNPPLQMGLHRSI